MEVKNNDNHEFAMKRYFMIALIFTAFLLPATALSQKKKKESKPERKVLFVVTSHNKIDATGRPTGAYASEIIDPYQEFKQADFTVDVVSPRGGRVPLDGISELDDKEKKMIVDGELAKKLKDSLSPGDVNPSQYEAVFYPGGHGAMYDLPDHPTLQRVTSEVFESGGVVGAVCHGPAGILNVKLSSGEYLVKDKEVAAFTNEEEESMHLLKAMPFLLEDALKERGAKFTKVGRFKKHIAISSRLVTGQNPNSARGVAKVMVDLLNEFAMTDEEVEDDKVP